MRLVNVRADDGWSAAVLQDGKLFDLRGLKAAGSPRSVDEVLAAGPDALSAVRDAMPQASWSTAHPARFGPALRRPSKVLAIGQNYLDHVKEQGKEPPETPLIFSKNTSSIIGPGVVIQWDPKLTREVDFECELGVVIGRTMRRVAEDDAMDHVAGYVAVNDVTARDLQRNERQWVRAKGLDTFCPIAAQFVTADEVADPHALRLGTRLNGQVMQESDTSNLIFPIPVLLSYVSHGVTLNPGDLVLTGTPPGVGAFRKPPVFLATDDEVEVWVEGLGSVANTCRALDG